MTKHLAITPKVTGGYAKARAKIDERINNVVAELYNKFGTEEFVFSSVELSNKCGTREYAAQRRDYFFIQTYRGNSISKKMSTYRIRQEHFTPEIKAIAKTLFEREPPELREIPQMFDEMRYVTFNINNIKEAQIGNQFQQADRFKLKQLERALLAYGEQEDPDNEHLITLGIPHNQKGGRLYATWPFCLQCTSSDLRHVSIFGDSLDLDAAAVQCMAELGLLHGGHPNDVNVLKDYIRNKRSIRTQLSMEFAVPEDTVKCIFNILVLGGKGSPTQVKANYKNSNSIACVVGDNEIASKIVACEFVSKFYAAIKALRKLIVNALSEDIGNGWRITNENGITKTWLKNPAAKRHVKPMSKIANFIYQNWELSTMTENMKSLGDRGLPVHDSREGILDLEEVCNSFDDNHILYEVTRNLETRRFTFPHLMCT